VPTTCGEPISDYSRMRVPFQFSPVFIFRPAGSDGGDGSDAPGHLLISRPIFRRPAQIAAAPNALPILRRHYGTSAAPPRAATGVITSAAAHGHKRTSDNRLGCSSIEPHTTTQRLGYRPAPLAPRLQPELDVRRCSSCPHHQASAREPSPVRRPAPPYNPSRRLNCQRAGISAERLLLLTAPAGTPLRRAQ